jgi:outer membrane protein TolC
MKKIIVFFLLLVLNTGAFSEGFEKVLTLDSSIRAALNIHPDILSQINSSELAVEKLKEAKALYMPVVDINFNLSSFNNIYPMTASNLQNSVLFPADKRDMFYTTRIAVVQTIFSGGRISSLMELAKINMDKVETETSVVRNKVVNDIKLAFNECLFYRDLRLYYERAGGAQSKKRASAARLAYEKNILDLIMAIGYELNAIVNIKGDFIPIIKDIDLPQCLALTYLYKSEIRSFQQQESVDALSANLITMQRYPVVSVGAAQEWSGDQRIINNESSWYVAMNINVPIYDGGSMFSKIRQTKINARNLSLERTKAEDAIKLEVHKAYLDYSFYKAQALEMNLPAKKSFNDEELEIIRNLNRSYYNLEHAIGVELDKI